jgi:hypothetical protein
LRTLCELFILFISIRRIWYTKLIWKLVHGAGVTIDDEVSSL